MQKLILLSLFTHLALISSVTHAQKVDTTKTHELKEVLVQGIKNSYKEEESNTVSKMSLKDIENPQSYNSISKELLKDQQVTNFNDALKNATGVSRLWESTGRGGDGAEYYAFRGFEAQHNMVNGVAGITDGNQDPANVETIEVIKGPSGALYGGSLISYGGLINVVTKKPYETVGGEASIVTGENNLKRFTIDLNTPINGKAFFRLNSAYHLENSFQDAGFYKSFFIAPALMYKSNSKLTFFLNTELKLSEGANAPMLFLNRYGTLSFSSIDIFEKNYFKSYTSNTLTIQNPTYNVQAQALYKINAHWSSQTIVAASNTKSNGYYQYLWDFLDGDQYTRYISKRNSETNSNNIQQNFTGDLKWLGFRHRILLGADYLYKSVYNQSTPYVADGVISLKNQKDEGKLTSYAVDSLLSTKPSQPISKANINVLAAYASDLIEISPSMSVMVSLRIDNFSGIPSHYLNKVIKNQVGISPKVGFVYAILPKKLSVFGNYMNGFKNLDPVTLSDVDGSNSRVEIFEPEHANQWEVGMKADLYKGRIGFTTSYYSILVSNILMVDPKNINNRIQGGEVESKGFELSFVTNPIEGVSIIAGYSYNKSKVVRETEGEGYLGLRPEEAGPENLLNWWITYKTPFGKLKDLGIGFGGNYASEHKTLNRLKIGTFTLPAYTVINASLFYNSPKWGVNLKVDNLGNQKYYSGWSTVSPQKLRNLSLGLILKF